MAINLKGKDILATSDWTIRELDEVFDLAFKFKRMGVASQCTASEVEKAYRIPRRSSTNWISLPKNCISL